jgi:5,10-methylenetetrahydromethanopterin reductase
MTFSGEWGIKFALQTAPHYAVPDLVRLAQLAEALGFKQIWVNDNLCQRNVFVALAAVAATVPIKLGTSIITPYFRNPVDLADSLAALAELAGGRELSVGIARGDVNYAGQQIEMPKPMAMVRETTLALKALLGGQSIVFQDYPTAAAYHNIRPQQEFHLAFAPPNTIRFYSGGNGPKILQVAGEIMDGALIGNHYIPLVRSGRLDALLQIERQSAKATQPGKILFDIAELDISVSRDRQHAIQFARPYAARIIMALESMGFTHGEICRLGIEPGLGKVLRQACGGEASLGEAAALLPDHAVASCFVVGTPEQCRDQLAPLLAAAERYNLGQISFTKLGPDYDDAIHLLRRQVLPL